MKQLWSTQPSFSINATQASVLIEHGAVLSIVLTSVILSGLLVPQLSDDYLIFLFSGFAGAIAFIGLLQALGFRRLGEFCLYLAAFSITWNDIRLASWMTVSDAFLILSFILIAASRRPSNIAFGPYVIVFSGIFMIMFGGLLGSFFSESVSASASRLIRFSTATIGMFSLFGLWAPDRRKLETVLWLLIASACVSAAYALVLEPDGGFGSRSAGLTTHPNHLAIISVMAAGSCLALAWRHGPSRIFAIGALGLLIAAIGVSGSRAGIVGLVAIVAVVTLTSKGRSLWGWLSLGALATTLLLAGNLVSPPSISAVDRLLAPDSSAVSGSNDERIELLTDSFKTIKRHPITGTGFENSRRAHNLFLQVWASSGILGVVGFSLVIFRIVLLPLIKQWQAFQVADPFVLGVLAGLCGYLLAGLFNNQIWDRYIWFLLAIALAACIPPAFEETGYSKPREDDRDTTKVGARTGKHTFAAGR